MNDTPYSGHNRPKARRDTRPGRSLGVRRLSEPAWQTTQRVHNCCCQLIFWKLRFTGKPPTPGVLTVQCLMLSKPKQPRMVFKCRKFSLHLYYTYSDRKSFNLSGIFPFISANLAVPVCHFERRTQSEVGKSVFEICQISPLRSTGPPVEMTR